MRSTETAVLSNPVPGSPCLAWSDELGDKYRAEVVEVGEGGVTVRYVDYGNQETVCYLGNWGDQLIDHVIR